MTDTDLFGSDLMAVVAHDLKLPITAVQGYIELIQHSGPLNEAQMLYASRALDGLQRMADFIAGLLAMAELEKEGALEFVNCDLNAIALSAIDLVEALAEKQQITIVAAIDDDVDSVYGDPHLLGQVLNNLLTNAIKYNREGGEISVTVTNQPDFVRVDVRDTGVGIPEQDQPNVFDQFFRAGNSAQSRTAGSGLGLAIVKAIVQKHQGYVWLKSQEGEGSVFSFTIPRKNRPHDNADRIGESAGRIAEGSDLHLRTYEEASIEESDDIDDNTQESRESKEIDSSNDVV